jgi:serine protease Do
MWSDMFTSKSVIALAALSMAVSSFAQSPRRARSATMRAAVERGYLGVGVIELTADRVRALGLKNDNGVEVKRVDDNSPAAKAGLKVNDVILEVNGKTVEDMEQFIGSIGDAPAGAKLNLTVWRSGAKRTITATLDARPENPFFGVPDQNMPPMPPMPPSGLWDGNTPFSSLTGSGALVGFEGEALSPQLAEYFAVKDGVLVRTVGPNTPAERAGLKAGDVVIKVNGTPVTSPREISGLVRAKGAKMFSFTVVRNKKEISLNVEISEVRLPSFENDVL